MPADDVEMAEMGPYYGDMRHALLDTGANASSLGMVAKASFRNPVTSVDIGTCVPYSNCCVVIPQDKLFALERFGGFQRILGPGLHCVGLDVAGFCLGFRSVSTRIEQIKLGVSTKTKDHVFISVFVALQTSVDLDHLEEAFYAGGDVRSQIESIVSEIVRAKVPAMDVDQVFISTLEIADEILRASAAFASELGYQIHCALITDLALDSEVMQSMEEVARQKRLTEAIRFKAEAENIKVVKSAEAAAEAAMILGQGCARGSNALIRGLRSSLFNAEVPDAAATTQPKFEDVMQLYLLMGHFDSLRQIGASQNADVIFTVEGPRNVPLAPAQQHMRGKG